MYMNKHIIRIFIISIITVAIGSCATEHLNTSGLPNFMDFHGVEATYGYDKFNLRSISDINRDAKQSVNNNQGSSEFIGSGGIKDWQWDIYSEPSVANLVRSFNSQRDMVVDKNTSPHKLDIPSLNASMKEFYRFYSAIIGTELLPLHLQLVIYPENIHVRIEKTLHSNTAVPMYFAFSIPEKVGTEGGAAYSWLVDTLGLIGHEYWHAYNRENKNARFINKMTEGVTAYTLERCLRTALANGQGTFHLVDIGGSPINVKTLEQKREELSGSPGTVGLSLEAKTLSLYNMAWVLNTNVIEKHDVALKEKLYGLCYAMIHNPVDMTQGFYPADKVKSLAFDD